jgi:hypothetical protein
LARAVAALACAAAQSPSPRAGVPEDEGAVEVLDDAGLVELELADVAIAVDEVVAGLLVDVEIPVDVDVDFDEDDTAVPGRHWEYQSFE